MKIIKKSSYRPQPHVCVVIPVFKGAALAELWQEFPELEYPARQKRIKGEIGEALACHSLEQRRLFLLVGAGKPGRLADARRLACRTMTLLREHLATRALLYFAAPLPYPPEYLRNLVDYLHLNNYRFDRYRKKKSKPVERIELAFKKRVSWSGAEWPERAIVLEEARLARDLVNEIPARANPDAMVQAFAAAAGRHGLKLEAWRRPELEANGMSGLLAVGASSCCEPALLTLTHEPRDFSRTVVLVGKGITFDAGGLNLKPGNSMEEMKCDMAGAAAVLGALSAVARLRLPLKVIGLAPLTENLPGRRAYKPGDIITYANKKTVEVVNTDAEGRLILADALIVAARLKPDMIIELSTLTGAIVTALGDSYAGLFCRNRRLSAGLLQAAESSGELLWEMPLPGEYRESIASKVADLKNANYNGASSIKAGLFLSEFTGRVPFAHIDIAGTAFLSKPNFCLNSEGATGFGVRLLVEFLQNLG
ncbi:MAG: leucyl aminopeptidase [Acidobacteria bacterium]|jgi:leucyl aminopeptidase|nr:leucyl aminopeptidase [Acidobacteriota bacterium]